MSKKTTLSERNVQPRTQMSQSIKQCLTFERLFLGGIGLVILGVVGALVFNAWQNRVIPIDELEHRVGLLRTHQEITGGLDSELPPMGGTHYPVWQNCGVYDAPIVTDSAIHSLEHGAVWITYHPELPVEQVERLREITDGGTHRLLSPYPGLARPIVVTAWGYQLQLEDADDSRLLDFINNYEQGPDSPEPGAPCAGGGGEPIR